VTILTCGTSLFFSFFSFWGKILDSLFLFFVQIMDYIVHQIHAVHCFRSIFFPAMKLTNGETMGKMEQFCFPDGQGRIEIDFLYPL
jgi:hypothetical protein